MAAMGSPSGRSSGSVDRFGDTLAIQPNAAWAERIFDVLAEVLQGVTGATTLYKNASGRARGLDGLDDVSGVHCGEIPGPILVGMRKPVHILQRGDDVKDIVNLATIAVVEAQENER